ncbi:hypothetical protein SLE2022_153620 [Rubroshorea leprosula]|uniref:Uncharacterized protein n=1 Tax=Rubroshorea leprosula TaxID=152421 RepID=A0AAV5LDW0_9ROSI|nr:hypothetical protein SLEP1_g43566 [Rubroshorea leprosula]
MGGLVRTYRYSKNVSWLGSARWAKRLSMGPVQVCMYRNHAPITANIASLPFFISFVLNSSTLSGNPLPNPGRVKPQPTQVAEINSRELVVGENWVCIYASRLDDISPPSMNYKQSGGVDEVFLLPSGVPGRGFSESRF